MWVKTDRIWKAGEKIYFLPKSEKVDQAFSWMIDMCTVWLSLAIMNRKRMCCDRFQWSPPHIESVGHKYNFRELLNHMCRDRLQWSPSPEYHIAALRKLDVDAIFKNLETIKVKVDLEELIFKPTFKNMWSNELKIKYK